MCDNEGCEVNWKTCPCDVKEIYINGSCEKCMAEHCFLCNVEDPYSCDVCMDEYMLEDGECVYKGCESNNATCPCSPYDVYINGSCMECMAEDCLLCNVEDPYSCDVCMKGYINQNG